MRAQPSCPRCGSNLHPPGLWSSAWSCHEHGPVPPVQPVVQPTPEVLRAAAVGSGVPVWLPWPLPRGWLVTGVVTAGDLTRRMERQQDIFDTPVAEVMNPSPKTVPADALAGAAVFLMETHGIMALPAVDNAGRVVGIVHLHDLLRANAV